MNLRTSDMLLTRFAYRMPGVLRLLGDLESDLLRRQIEPIAVDRPVFITGLARSGTTILLNLFSSVPGVGTHRYRDFPFLFVPYSWNQLQSHLASTDAPIERPHQDRILITKDSPDAFEEPIWMHFFPFVHDARARHVLRASHDNPEFNAFYVAHLRKILLLRGCERYVSKGNYNVARLEYLLHLFPDARFVIPIRHPLSHVYSLVRQHELFTRYSQEDARVPGYMRAAGHYEFGPQRVPINLDEESTRRTLEAWRNGDDALGYALMWRSVYAHARDLARNEALAEHIRIVRYEDLCADPVTTLRGLFEFCQLTDGIEELLRQLPEISQPAPNSKGLSAEQRERVWSTTADLARRFGYQADGACSNVSLV
jgi:hypothetical protein